VMPPQLIEIYCLSGGTCCLNIPGSNHTTLTKVKKFKPNYVISQGSTLCALGQFMNCRNYIV